MPVTLIESNEQYKITIPNNIVQLEGVKAGQKFNIVKIQGYLALEPVR
ncbi:hypothetical protein RE474_00090 [Methanolobus sediminis]|uniref:Uncharacterized protein n=1 Tax=Methanolobus sediminis TaxID=3072978 RepID=A0AA51YM29_9EURY|nr:hypothetical protein [Methanolobus sediminis]WMW25153.1 hypothetical protein RE474_00090 [Methanolobus sediminis]